MKLTYFLGALGAFAIGALAIEVATTDMPASAAVPQVSSVSGMAFPAMQPDLNTLIASINANVNDNTLATFQNFRNVLDNGDICVTTRGTSAINCSTTAGSGSGVTKGTGYSADRWMANANISNNCKSQVASTSPPPGFANFVNIWRDSGVVLTQHCLIQEIPTNRVVQLQGQQVVMSAYEKSLAGLAADNGSLTQMFIWTGTGSDEGLGTMSGGNAPSPAFTGLATPLAVSFTITGSFQRYQSAPALIPLTATEAAVGYCFSPTATGSGTTDGFSITGMQLEQSSTVASSFEYLPLEIQQQKAQRFYFVYLEATGPNTPNFTGYCQATNTPTFAVPFPYPMRAAPSVPTSGNSQVLTVGGINISIASAAKTGLTGITSVSSGTTTNFGDIAGTNTCTAGGAIVVSTTAATGIIPFTADF